MAETANLSMHKPVDDSDLDNEAQAVARRRRKIRLALLLGVIAVSFYVLSIASIVFTRGGAA